MANVLGIISVLLFGCVLLFEPQWRIYASINYPSLLQILACRLEGAKLLSEPMLEYYNKLQWNLKRSKCIFVQENAFQNVVCEMATILSPLQCVNSLFAQNIFSLEEISPCVNRDCDIHAIL